MIKAFAFLFLCASPVVADTLPAHFVTRGVAADDTLNIRAKPDASAEIIGEYGPHTLNIEVITTSSDGAWGFVGMGERNGWVAMQYLERSDHQDENAFPRPMTCLGTEPFWTLNVTTRGDEYHELGFERRDLEMTQDMGALNGAMAVFQEGPSLNRTLIVQKGYCGDGMSDREFGWKATLFTEAPDGNYVQSGCCTMDANH